MNSAMRRALLLLLLLPLLAGCAGHQAFRSGQELLLQGKYDAAVAEFSRALNKNPESHEYRMELISARTKAALQHLENGRRQLDQEKYEGAVEEFGLAAMLDPSLVAAGQGLEQARRMQKSEELLKEAEEYYRARRFPDARDDLERVLRLRPESRRAQKLLAKVRDERRAMLDGQELQLSSEKPITLKFKDAKIRDVFNILSKLSGINFIFDEDLKPQNVSVYIEDASFPQALELLLKMNDLGKKVLNPHTIIIYNRTKQKEKQYQDQIIQTFYLSNIDAKKAVNLLRTMLQLRKVYVHEELNALVIRDTPEVVKLAQKILEAADRKNSEVVLDLELVEVNHGDTLNLGPSLSNYSLSAGLSKAGSGKILADTLAPGDDTTNLASGLHNLDTFYSIPTATFDFLKKLEGSEILANPSIRVRNKEKAKVHIGSREPVITTTVTGTDQFSENIQYVDVGVKLDVEPTIQLDGSIVTKVALEVSNATRLAPLKSGTTPLLINTTNAQTTLTLQDGERTVIGGLIRDDSSKTRQGIPLLSDIPLIGSLFTSHANTKTKREILLSITPHIVENADIPDPSIASIWSGGEDDLKTGPNFSAFAENFQPATDKAPVDPVPASAGATPLASAAAAPVAAAPQAPAAVSKPTAAPAAAPVVRPKVAPAPPKSLPQPAPSAPAALSSTPATKAAVPPPVSVPPLAIPPKNPARLLLQGPAQVAPGSEFTVTLAVEGVKGLYSAPMFISYPPKLLEFVRAEEGGFLRQGGETTIFTVVPIPAQGRLIVGFKQGIGGHGASGKGTLMHLVFRAKGPGKATLKPQRINFRNPQGERLSLGVQGLTLEVR